MAKITKRDRIAADGTKYATYDIRYLDRASFTQKGKPRHRQESFKRRKDAERRLLELQNELGSGKHIALREKLTVAGVCERYLKHQEMRASDKRIGRQQLRSSEIAVRASIIPLLGGKLYADLTALDIERFYVALVKEKGVLLRPQRRG